MTDLEAENKLLRQRIEELTFELAEARGRAGAPLAQVNALMQHLHITAGQARILRLLSDAKAHDRSHVISTCCLNPDVEPNTISVQLSRIRKRIPDITIACTQGLYLMDKTSCERIRQIMEGKRNG